MILTVIRNILSKNSTGGVLLVNGEKFCHVQEDTARAFGAKIFGETCISPGAYKVAVRRSASFGRKVLCLYTEIKDWRLIGGGIEFQYVYFHGGNDAGDTKGCILAAFNRVDDETIQGTAESALFNTVQAAIDSGERIVCEVVSDFNNVYGLR